ncbi:MAG: protein kinase [Myxococcales bacterium]|nr:protein kinase [Myxococcales bacterium]MCB9672293.1 protein kinase [Alphaproteobacteria bacterium]MCB9692707.1 protein kinase [Alphaproteobacteria bacterium]
MNYPRKYGNYVLLERLGIGGMSEVDLARQRMGDKDFYRFVVIKRIKTDKTGDDAFIRMFKDEARITSELHHECIGQVYEFGREGDEYFLVLEYVPGIDVRAMINALRERGQRVPVRVALRILCDVLEGLEYAHRKRDAFGKPMRIVHRDVNPRNVMVSIHGDTKLIDFGVAKASDRLERTKTDHVKGKFSYMAPEQVTGGNVDHRADLFAVGLTLHEFLAGYGPFFGLNQVQIVHRLLHGQIPEMPSVRDLPDEDMLRKVHDKALAPDPRERYQSAADFREDLVKVAESVGGLPKREQIARFLQKVDPGITERLQEKMRGYSGELDLTTHTDRIPHAGGLEPVEDVSGTMESQVALRPGAVNPNSDYTSTQFTTTGAAVAGVGVLGLAVVATAVVTSVVVLGTLLWLEPWNKGGPAVPDPVPVQQPVPPTLPTPPPKPVEPVTPDPAPVVEPAPEPVQPEPVRPEPVRPQPIRPVPVRPQPDPVRPTPVPPPPDPEPAPVPQPDPAPVVTQPPPKPPPQPTEPDPATLGTLVVNAPEEGLVVYVNGTPRGKTKLQIRLPEGTYEVRVDGYSAKMFTIRKQQMTPALFR